jgi:hypothetical protein
LTPPDITVALWQPEHVFFRTGLTFFSKAAASTATFEGGAAAADPIQSTVDDPIASRDFILLVGKRGMDGVKKGDSRCVLVTVLADYN